VSIVANAGVWCPCPNLGFAMACSASENTVSIPRTWRPAAAVDVPSSPFPPNTARSLPGQHEMFGRFWTLARVGWPKSNFRYLYLCLEVTSGVPSANTAEVRCLTLECVESDPPQTTAVAKRNFSEIAFVSEFPLLQ